MVCAVQHAVQFMGWGILNTLANVLEDYRLTMQNIYSCTLDIHAYTVDIHGQLEIHYLG